MAANRDFVRFLTWTTAVIFVGALLAVLLVVVVDPYQIHRLVDIPGFNRIKPTPDRYQEEIKLTGARAMNANVFMMGNSRAEIGLNPDYTGFSAHGYSAYNLSISGTRVSTARREFEYLRDVGQKPAMIVLGLEFLDFLIDPSTSQPPYQVAKSAHAVDGLKWKFETLFSLSSTLDAMKTLQIQHRPEAETMTLRGFNPLQEYKKYAREEGYNALFQQRAMENAKSYVRKPRSLIAPETGSSRDLDELRAFFSAVSKENTELHLIIYPYHAQILAMFEQTGLWPLFEEWKRLLAREVDAVRKANPDSRITLWDFSGFSNFQCEIIPEKGDTTKSTQWYWEAGHFKPALGDVMLARLLDKPKEPFVTGDLGFPLTLSGLDENRQRIERERAACLASYPELFSDVAKIVRASL